MTTTPPKPRMNAFQKKIFDWIVAHPVCQTEDIVRDLGDPTPEAQINSEITRAVYFLYFNGYLMISEKWTTCLLVNPYLTPEELETTS